MALILTGTAGAETLVLPPNLAHVSAHSFEDCAGLEAVICPDGLQSIGEYAFAGCTQLASISIPSSVSSIGVHALPDSQRPLLVRTSAGSAAMQYAQKNQLDYQADTTYRALLIGQSHYQTAAVLEGTVNDVRSMQTVLSSFPDTPYSLSIKKDLTADQILREIADGFAQAQPQDVSLLFYAGHGEKGGSLIGIDGLNVSPSALKSCLDQIPGRKILIVDACYSGAMIGRSLSETGPQDFTSAFLSAFATRTRSTLAADEYYVMTAASGSQSSAEIMNGSRSYGVFTTMLTRGCGYDYLTDSACSLYADADQDSVVTFEEAYQYAKKHALQLYSGQSAQVWPQNCTYLGFLRK